MQAQCPWRWYGLVSNFGNGHTRVSNSAGMLSVKDWSVGEPSGGQWPFSLCRGINTELTKARQGLVSKAGKQQKGSDDWTGESGSSEAPDQWKISESRNTEVQRFQGSWVYLVSDWLQGNFRNTTEGQPMRMDFQIACLGAGPNSILYASSLGGGTPESKWNKGWSNLRLPWRQDPFVCPEK